MMFTPGWTCSICGEATVYEPHFPWATFMHLECYARYMVVDLNSPEIMELGEFSTRHLDAIPQD
jgi:hypothetical protein